MQRDPSQVGEQSPDLSDGERDEVGGGAAKLLIVPAKRRMLHLCKKEQ